MYAALVPEIHKSFLETIPQQVGKINKSMSNHIFTHLLGVRLMFSYAALFHNNCNYLAHHLLTLACKYKNRLPNHSEKFSIIYVDQSLLLRQVGSEYFLNHMKCQRDIIFGILRQSGTQIFNYVNSFYTYMYAQTKDIILFSALSSIGQMPELPDSTDNDLRQCVRQLEFLGNVWKDILPLKVYCRALGCIVNDMVDDLNSKMISVEDIPASIASELVRLFEMVVKRIPEIFPVSLITFIASPFDFTDI